MFDINKYIDEIKEKASTVPDIDKDTIESLLGSLLYINDAERRKIMDSINLMINGPYTEHVLGSRNPVLGFPSNEESVGDILVGYTCAGDRVLYPFYFRLEEIREGILVCARSGHGKTRLVYNIVGSLVDLGINFVIWDIKDDYIEIASLHNDVLVIDWKEIKFNPITNVPKGMDIRIWWRKLWEVFCHSFGILIASSSYILEKLEEIYEDRKGLVTFKDLYQFVKSTNENSRKKEEYLDVSENRLYAVNHALGDVLDCRYGFDISDMFSQKIVIRMRGLDTTMQGFLIQSLLMHEFYSRMYERVKL